MIKPILIKSNDIGIIGRYSYKDELILRNNNKDIPRGEDVDIILIDTDAEIKEGDKVWGSKSQTDNVYSIMEYTKGICSLKTVSKIIASTNKNHNLPQLSTSSIEILVYYYNEYGKFPEEVEYILTNYKGEIEILIP